MLELKAKSRPKKGRAKQIRKQDYVPAILYGPKIKNVALMVGLLEITKAYKSAGESTLLKLKIKEEEKDKEYSVLIHDIKRDPVHDQIIHVDFYQPRLDKEITAEVPLVFMGQSSAINDLGGVLIKNFYQVEVEALPQKLPREINVDISSLKTFNDIIHVKDLKLEEGARINAESDEVIALVESPRTQADLESLEESVEEKPEEVKIEGEDKEKVEVEEEEKPKQEVKEEERKEEK